MYSISEKRLSREIFEIINDYKNISIIQNDNKYILKIKVSNRFITIQLDHKYPFKQPNVIIGTIPYHTMLCISDTFIINKLNSIYKIDCLCCKSIICPNNWKPIKNIVNILDEIKINTSIVQSLLYMKYTYMICNSYNIFCEEIPELICKNFLVYN